MLIGVAVVGISCFFGVIGVTGIRGACGVGGDGGGIVGGIFGIRAYPDVVGDGIRVGVFVGTCKLFAGK